MLFLSKTEQEVIAVFISKGGKCYFFREEDQDPPHTGGATVDTREGVRRRCAGIAD